MRFIEFFQIPLCLVFVSSCLAAPSETINFQGNAGQYSFNYEEPMSSRSESRSSDGMTRGTYSYFDANGQLQTAEYEAGQNLGFNVKATNLPQAPLPVTEAPEVLVARQKHLQLLEEANRQENNGAMQGINHGSPAAPEAIQRALFLEDSLHLLDTTGAKKDSMKESNRPVGTQSARHLNAPIAGAQLIPESNRKIFAFPGWGNEPVFDFPGGHSRDVNSLPLPKGSANLPNFPKGSTNFPNFPKRYDHLPSFPMMGDGNFNQFLKGNPEFPSLPRSEATPAPLSSFSPFPKGNTNFPSFPQLGTDFSPKGNFNFPPFLTSNEFSSPQKSGTDALLSSNVSPLLKGNTNFPSLPKIGSDFLPKGNFNFPPFLTSNEFSSPQKSGTDALPSPFLKENVNFPSLPKSGADSSLLLNEKSEFMPSNGAFSSVPKSDATTQPLLKNDANSASFPKENVNSPLPNNRVDTFPLLEGRVNSNPFLKDQVINNPLPNDKISPTLKSNVEGSLSPLPKIETPSTLSEETPKQRDAVAMPSTSEKTPEAAVAREAQLQSVTEAVSKSTQPSVINPEDLSARGAHLQIAADPEAARRFFEVPKFTPEVQAAREAHFRAYALAAKLAVESDINPKILELFLGRPGEPKLGSQKIAELENLLLKGVTDEGIKRLMENPAMMMEAPMKGIDAPKGNMPMPTDNRGINNLMEKPQVKEVLKMPQIQLDTGITPAGTSLKIPDTRVASIDEFQQSKQKAEINLICGTALKVKELNDNKSDEDQRLIIVKSGNPTSFLGNVHLPIDQSEQWRNNWALQYMSV